MVTYYSMLEVSADATQEEIKRSYRRLVKLYHPDNNNDDKRSEELFKNIDKAYKILSNEKLRKEYDEKLIEEKLAEAAKTANSNKQRQKAQKRAATNNDEVDEIAMLTFLLLSLTDD